MSSFTPPFTITAGAKGWTISDATPRPVAGASFGTCCAFIDTTGIVTIQEADQVLFAGQIQTLAGLAAGTNNVRFLDLVNTFLGKASAAAGVASVTAGTGISITGTGTNPIVNNTGVITAGTGTGITNTGTATNPVFANSGVISVTAGTNVTNTGTAQNPILNATASGGVATVTAGTGISVTGTGTNPIVNNTGVISITAGTNITNTGTAQNPVLNSTASGGVTSVTAGTNMRNDGTVPAPIISLGTGSQPYTVGQTSGNFVKLYNTPGTATALGSGHPVPVYFLGNCTTSTGTSGVQTASLLNGTGPQSIPANWFVNNTGDRFELRGVGRFGRIGTGVVPNTLQMVVNSVNIITYTFTPAVGVSFNFEFSIFLYRVSSTSAAAFMKIFRSDGAFFISPVTSIPTITMTSAVVVDFQATGSNASDTFTCNQSESFFSCSS